MLPNVVFTILFPPSAFRFDAAKPIPPPAKSYRRIVYLALAAVLMLVVVSGVIFAVMVN